MLNKYGSTMPALYKLRKWYLDACGRMGQEEISKIPWALSVYDNGEKIQKAHRKLYRDRADLRAAFPNPYSTSDPNQSYYLWYKVNVEGGAEGPSSSKKRNHDAPSDPLYRIFLSVDEASKQFVLQTAQNLIATNCRNGALYLAGSTGLLAQLSTEEQISRNFQLVPVVSSGGHPFNFDAILNRFSDQDFLFVKSGAIVPDACDIRLAWSAHFRPGVATASPVAGRSGATAIDPGGKLFGSKPPAPDLIDAACHHYSQYDHPEIPAFLEGCFYVRSRAWLMICLFLPTDLSIAKAGRAILSYPALSPFDSSDAI